MYRYVSYLLFAGEYTRLQAANSTLINLVTIAGWIRAGQYRYTQLQRNKNQPEDKSWWGGRLHVDVMHRAKRYSKRLDNVSVAFDL